jgi:hypothetical protein
LLLISSLIGCFLGTYLYKPTSEEVLDSFYKNVRPWGFWKPVKERVLAVDPSFKPNTNFKADMFNIVIGIVWQTAIIAIPVFIVLRQWWPAGLAIAITAITSSILKFTWWDKLPND